MAAKHSTYISLISVTGDFIILNLCFNIAFCYMHGFDKSCFEIVNIIFFFFINIAWIFSAKIFKVYPTSRQIFKKTILSTHVKTVVFFFFLFLLFFQLFTFNYYQRDEIKILFIVFSLSLILWKFLHYFISHFYRKSGYNYRNVVIVGYNSKAIELKDYFTDNPWAGYQFKGFFSHQKSDKKDIAGTYDELENYVFNYGIDEIYILVGDIHKSIHKTISSIMSKHPVKIRFVPDLSDFSYKNIKLIDYDNVPVLQIQQGPLNLSYNRLIKRVFDIGFSVIVIGLVLSWLIPLLKLIDLFNGNDGLFFIQPRSGLNNHTFNLIKFRTMKKNGEAHTTQATENDKRITRLGRLLRKTSLDELPQFVNILMGDMTMIGPRPHMLKHTEKYKMIVDKFMVRHTVKPGITGFAQIKGYRGEIKKIRDMENRIKLDIDYIENWSVWLDLTIIFSTILIFIRGDKKAY